MFLHFFLAQHRDLGMLSRQVFTSIVPQCFLVGQFALPPIFVVADLFHFDLEAWDEESAEC